MGGKTVVITAATAFWLFVAVFVVVDAVVFLHGADSYLYSWKTPVEREIQKKILEVE